MFLSLLNFLTVLRLYTHMKMREGKMLSQLSTSGPRAANRKGHRHFPPRAPIIAIPRRRRDTSRTRTGAASHLTLPQHALWPEAIFLPISTARALFVIFVCFLSGC